MDREVLHDNLRLDKVAQVEMHVEGLLDDRLSLPVVELLKEVRSIALELHHASKVAHSALHLDDLADDIEQDVVDVDHQDDLVRGPTSVISGIKDASILQERLQGFPHRRHILPLHDEAIVWVTVEGHLPLFG